MLLVQGGIHAGEIDGKDAGFLALRELLDGSAAPGALGRVTVVFVPVFNVDGHERFGRWNRPNQRGPEEMGWRTTAQNLNLNRDYAKAEAPEMQAMLGLLDAWDPILYVDLHVTDGAQFQHDVSIQVEPCDGWRRSTLAAHGLRAARRHDRATSTAQGFTAAAVLPVVRARRRSRVRLRDDRRRRASRTATGPARNRIRHAGRDALVEDLRAARRARHARRILATGRARGRDGTSGSRPRAPPTRGPRGSRDEPSRCPGESTDAVAHDRLSAATPTSARLSRVSGRPWIRYDETTPQIWHVPLRVRVVPDLERHRARAAATSCRRRTPRGGGASCGARHRDSR